MVKEGQHSLCAELRVVTGRVLHAALKSDLSIDASFLSLTRFLYVCVHSPPRRDRLRLVQSLMAPTVDTCTKNLATYLLTLSVGSRLQTHDIPYSWELLWLSRRHSPRKMNARWLFYSRLTHFYWALPDDLVATWRPRQ